MTSPRTCSVSEPIPYLIDGHVEYLAGFKEFVPEHVPFAPCGGWFEFSDELIKHRNESIKRFWTAERRAEKSELTKRVHRNHDPAVNAKRSQALKLSHARPETRAKLSAAQKAVWARRRAAKT